MYEQNLTIFPLNSATLDDRLYATF